MDLTKPQPLPVFIENPDGSLVQGVVAGYEDCSPPTTPRTQVFQPGLSLGADVIKVLARHEMLFLFLLALQLLVECIFETMHVQYREDAIFELELIYPGVDPRVLGSLYWSAIFAECAYLGAFLFLGVIAAFRGKPRLYQRFSIVALVGTLGQLPLAYLNRFNLLTFFLRFISYAYGRFQWNLLYGIGLLTQEFLI
mmetsp:Transcript_91707/g.296703  ORF Transcript_91707/g.296703 Transcript_91707/m.296703 type:complete len:196 (-) Transcript_91707:99-686(-)